MSARISQGPRSFGGGSLCGSRIVQLVYLDEAGLSRKKDEPYLIVAGVIVNADNKWREIESYFVELTKKYFPEFESTYGVPFVFHAMDIWHGSGKFPRDKWTRAQRMKLLLELSKVPSKFNLPVVAGYVRKDDIIAGMRARIPLATDEYIAKWTYAEAFIEAARRIEYWMKNNAPDEVAMLIAEDTDRVKELVGAIHASYTDRTIPINPRSFQSNYIVDAVHFTKKNNSIILQIADHMAFILKRRLTSCSFIEPMFKEIIPQLSLRGVNGNGLTIRLPQSHTNIVTAPSSSDAEQELSSQKPSQRPSQSRRRQSPERLP
ncbi:hypothetical protein J2X36_003134 [Methylobacterium sp. BE186]|uniref:DUF3800 domain-containing protein n=1 Tax=Methylobacterium sp. BE186 TaxID=2817715 RepID=UPI002856FF46|nr:DUF3800 domain-containing protein [Methylobacterium sp. BE186]MDR7038370.1 hypothetical protein [Methylobacterium sp. BE186]